MEEVLSTTGLSAVRRDYIHINNDPQERMMLRPTALEGGWRREWGSAGASSDTSALMA